MHVEGQPHIRPGRQAALNNHAKALASGHPKRQQAALIHLGKMKLNVHEQDYVHQHAQKVQQNPYAHITPRAERPLSDEQRGRLKPTDTGPTPILGYSEKQIAHPKRTAKNLKHFKAEHERNTANLESELNPLSRQNLSAAAEMTTNYHEIAHIRQHPVSGGLALAGFLPFGKAARGIELGVDAARGIDATEHAATVARAAEEARGLKKIALQRRAVRLGRRTTPEHAQRILEQVRTDAIAKATKAARKNPVFLEHLPDEVRPETGGAVGAKVRKAMVGAKKIYKQEKELQQPEKLKRTAMLAEAQRASKTAEEEFAASNKALAGELPRASFKNFEALKPHINEIRDYVNSLNMLPHDRNRLMRAIRAGIAGKVPTKSERQLIESVFGKEVKSLSPEAIKQRGVEGTAADILNIPRAIQSSTDLSGTLRQGLGALAYRPSTILHGFHETLRGAVSQAEFDKTMARDVYQNPYYHQAVADGVPITEMGERVNQREESFPSNYAENLHHIPGIRSTPGVKQVAQGVSAVVKGSDRHYILLLNRARIRLYEHMVERAAANGWRMDGPQGEKLRREIADTVATLTGRGNMGKILTEHRATFNLLFYSPGLIKSRINLLNPVWYLHASPFVRQQRMKAGLRLYGTLMTVLAAAKASGAEVSLDPTNADFGKIRIGDTRIDVAGGLTQYLRLVGQVWEGHITSSVTGKVEPLSNGPFKTSRGNVIQQFTRNKFAPVPGMVYDSMFGPGLGQKMTPRSLAGQELVPLMIQDMWQITHAKGPGGGPGMAAATFFPDLLGIGIQNYPGQPPKPKGSTGGFGGYGGSSGSDFGGYGGGGSSSSFGGYGP